MTAWLHGCMKEMLNAELEDMNVFPFNIQHLKFGIIFSRSAVIFLLVLIICNFYSKSQQDIYVNPNPTKTPLHPMAARV
jgi:hypothetical protein